MTNHLRVAGVATKGRTTHRGSPGLAQLQIEFRRNDDVSLPTRASGERYNATHWQR